MEFCLVRTHGHVHVDNKRGRLGKVFPFASFWKPFLLNCNEIALLGECLHADATMT